MNGDDELPRRSSSPLKRRASGMDPDADVAAKIGDADMPKLNAADALPRDMSVDVLKTDAPGVAQKASSQQQVKIIHILFKAFADAPVQEGDVAYVVSRSWMSQALSFRSDPKVPNVTSGEVSLGPVDNSDIIGEVIEDSDGKSFVCLIPGAGLESFELFPEDAWKLVMDWYGIKDGQAPIVRVAVNTAIGKHDPPNIMYEFHPPVFRVYRLWSQVSPFPIEKSLKAKNPPPFVLVKSAAAHAQTFLKDLKTMTGIPLDRKVRLFTLPSELPAVSGAPESLSTLTPPDSPEPQGPNSVHSRHAWPSLLLDIATFAIVRDLKVVVPIPDQTNNEKFNGHTSLHFYDLNSKQTLVLDESIGTHWVSTYTGREKIAEKAIPSRINATALSSKAHSNRSSPSRNGPQTRGRSQKKQYGRSTGAVGLHNLGNTCYMNSALQCVRSVEELTKYFLTESHIPEINHTNVLGYEGRVATAYGHLLKEVYEEGRSVVSPREFKSTVGRCRPTFSGWGQQDSQEFLGFLLDALQEDLSRIKKKPYIEKPDSTDDMINNPEAIREMADKVWDITRRRDDSVIADLFTGMYKSTLRCPECGKISITFDPFNNLTLPLPMEDMWTRAVKFFPLNDVPVKIEVELPKHSSIERLKQYVSDRTGVPVERLMGSEEFKDRFFKMYHNHQDVSEEISQTDTPTLHELEAVPTNWRGKAPRRKYRSMLDVDSPLDSVDSDDEQCETMVVPVLHRRPRLLGRAMDGVSPPHFITLTRKEASSLDSIQRKVLEKVATFSSWSKLADVSDASGHGDFADGDAVLTTASDADSSGDSKVAACSVEGEEDMVDITLKDAQGKPGAQSQVKRFNTRRPGFANPDSFLDPELQNLFELCYFRSDTDGTVPTGWSNVDNTCALPKLADRVPEVKEVDKASPESFSSTLSGNEDSRNEDDKGSETPQTRMTEESSDEDASQAARFSARSGRQHPKFGPGGRKKFKGHKTYSKKGNKRRDKQMRGGKAHHRVAPSVSPQPMPPAIADGGPLVRLYEGITVDWSEEAWETVFGNSGPFDAAAGGKTFANPEILHDAALKAKQRRQHLRITRGITLDECLDEFERAEVLSEQDMWYCPRCKEHRRASKKFDLWKTPDILVAHLKRFSNSEWRRDKLDVLVDFPIENLDLTSRVIEKDDGKAEVYDLIAVDDHYGGLSGGHYTAYAKNFVDGRWHSFNDSAVHVVSDPASVVTNAAYLLFYRRRSAAPLGGPRFAEIWDRYDKEAYGSEDEKSESGEDDGLVQPATGQRSRPDAERPPAYDETLRQSIEGDDAEASSSYQALQSKSLDMTQGWNFKGLGSRGTGGSTTGECGSDDAQLGSSGDEQGREVVEQDTDMASVEGDPAWEGRGVIAVPARPGSEGDSDSVAEIHLEGDSRSQSVRTW